MSIHEEEFLGNSDAEDCNRIDCTTREIHIHCTDCGSVILENEIYPECNYCEPCRIRKEQTGGVSCCSPDCKGEIVVWDEGELICNDSSYGHLHIHSCGINEKHFHCGAGSCGEIIESVDDDCDLCDSCRLEAESQKQFFTCENGCSDFQWCKNEYVCYCDMVI